MRMRLHWLAAALLFANYAWSQESLPPGALASRLEIYAGPAFAGSNSAGPSYGVGGGVNYRLFWRLGAVGEVTVITGAGGAGNTATLTDYLAGARIAEPLSRHAPVSLFADFLAGGESLNNSNGASQHAIAYPNATHAATAGDAGAEFYLVRHVAARGSFGFVASSFTNVSGTEDNYASQVIGSWRWRAAVNMVYRF
jgi:hypothetical protein